MLSFAPGRRRFSDLSEREILALAISAEEDDGRIYAGYAERLEADYPASASIFREMAKEEDGHRRALIAEHERRFGPTIPLIRREHVADYVSRQPVWLVESLGLERIRAEAERMEKDAARFYEVAAQRSSDAGTRRLLLVLTRLEPGKALVIRQVEFVFVIPIGIRTEWRRPRHGHISSTASTPRMARPLRITCPT